MRGALLSVEITLFHKVYLEERDGTAPCQLGDFLVALLVGVVVEPVSRSFEWGFLPRLPVGREHDIEVGSVGVDAGVVAGVGQRQRLRDLAQKALVDPAGAAALAVRVAIESARAPVQISTATGP